MNIFHLYFRYRFSTLYIIIAIRSTFAIFSWLIILVLIVNLKKYTMISKEKR